MGSKVFPPRRFFYVQIKWSLVMSKSSKVMPQVFDDLHRSELNHGHGLTVLQFRAQHILEKIIDPIVSQGIWGIMAVLVLHVSGTRNDT